MSLYVEVEVKKSSLPAGKVCEICCQTAVKTITIGEIQNTYGSNYDVCDSRHCEEAVLERYEEDVFDIRLRRNELMGQSRYDMREGK